jgi:hypothetical protein
MPRCGLRFFPFLGRTSTRPARPPLGCEAAPCRGLRAVYFDVCAIAAVATAIVFWVVVPRIGNLDRGALILAIVGAVTIIVFWAGLPVVLAGGATLLALEARERAATRLSTAALAIAALTVIAAVVLALFG